MRFRDRKDGKRPDRLQSSLYGKHRQRPAKVRKKKDRLHIHIETIDIYTESTEANTTQWQQIAKTYPEQKAVYRSPLPPSNTKVLQKAVKCNRSANGPTDRQMVRRSSVASLLQTCYKALFYGPLWSASRDRRQRAGPHRIEKHIYKAGGVPEGGGGTGRFSGGFFIYRYLFLKSPPF